jgi:hypothetical protein
MKIISGQGRYNFEPETDQEAKEFEELTDTCVTSPVTVLEEMLLKETSLWKSIILAEQILSDLEDYLDMCVSRQPPNQAKCS